MTIICDFSCFIGTQLYYTLYSIVRNGNNICHDFYGNCDGCDDHDDGDHDEGV